MEQTVASTCAPRVGSDARGNSNPSHLCTKGLATLKNTLGTLAAVFSIFALMLVISAPAQAQATRTFISGVGDDVNPCSRTAPCKTFAGAISKTAAGGEINCLDPGGFGTVTLTKSITLDCHEIFGSILHSATNGINIAFDSFGADVRKTVRIRNSTSTAPERRKALSASAFPAAPPLPAAR